jgi:C-terminal processing protease CtpA/Prc
MKRILFLVCISIFFAGCKKDEVKLSATQELNTKVNAWIYQNMTDLYYWNTTLPALKSTSASPSDYFKTLINKDDRFSAIFASYTDILNELNGVSSAEIGFNFQLYRESASNNNVLGIVLYIKPGTPAHSLGIKRGDIFRKINGTQMTMSNYSTVINYLLDSSASSSITFSTYQNGTFTDNTAMTVNKAANYQEDPVFMDSVYTVQNKKVGYLVYNFFTNDGGDNTMKYDLQLNTIIGNFKSQNISELIVDLRYNHGGMMTSAVNLASMLVPNLAANKVFTLTEYNQNYTDYFNSAAFKSQNSGDPFTADFALNITPTSTGAITTPVQNVGNSLQRIFFLTGRNTASASEMVINGLKPYLTCVLIGDTTVGKNVGSTLVHDTNNTQNQWAFMPIILKYFNKDHFSDFTTGFAPNYLVSDDYSHLLGDTRELLLATAISQISGQGVSASKTIQVKRVPLKSSIDFKRIQNGLIIDSKKFLKQK